MIETKMSNLSLLFTFFTLKFSLKEEKSQVSIEWKLAQLKAAIPITYTIQTEILSQNNE